MIQTIADFSLGEKEKKWNNIFKLKRERRKEGREGGRERDKERKEGGREGGGREGRREGRKEGREGGREESRTRILYRVKIPFQTEGKVKVFLYK